MLYIVFYTILHFMRFTSRFYVLIVFLSFSTLAARAQKDTPPANWQNLDLVKDGVLGMGTERAYSLLKDKEAKSVIVAVIDGGIDTAHEDLRDVLWRNVREVAANGVDDDKNGYVDDVFGWNFIGSSAGNVQYDTKELVRLVRKLSPKYSSALNSTPFTSVERKEFELYQRLITDYMSELEEAKSTLSAVRFIRKELAVILTKLSKQSPTIADFDRFKPGNDSEEYVLKIVKDALRENPDFSVFQKDLEEAYSVYTAKIDYHLNLDFDPRDLVADNYSDAQQRIYGTSDVKGPDAEHGTHVAGIIGAQRSNSVGVLGVSDKVKIMALRVVPDGDERDKDVANAIRYAVDHGAKIINMSFGKSYVWDKQVVDDAVRYAQLHDVLLVHAAGNDAKNTDVVKNYPTRFYTDSLDLVTGAAKAWLEVGASSWKYDEDLVASFSNYGSKNVDVFAPGVQINSTVPGNAYKDIDGTSMAAPAVSGLAALLRSYFPKLSAVQVKEIILKSVYKVNLKVKVLQEGRSVRLPFAELCSSGGVVNAYEAVLLALKTTK